jgi:hypothetical protein
VRGRRADEIVEAGPARDAGALERARRAGRLLAPPVDLLGPAALDLCERVFRYARKNVVAREAFREHGLDTFHAIEAHPGLPDRFVSRRLPQMRALIASSMTLHVELRPERSSWAPVASPMSVVRRESTDSFESLL